LGLFKNVQMQGAQETEPRGVYRYTLSGADLQRNTADERFSTAHLAAKSNANPVTIFIYRACTAQRRNGFACPAAKGNHDGVVNNPVATWQYFSQRKFRLVWSFCSDVAQPVGNSVHMGIDTNGVLAESKRNNKVGCFAANAFDAQQSVNVVRHLLGKAFD
jgi:hypothetical protein